MLQKTRMEWVCRNAMGGQFMDESDISKWDNNIERWRSADYDILNETVEGKPY